MLGVPIRITTDNGPQFRNQFEDFCKRWFIILDKSSPYHHQANGYAESAVGSMKSIIKKICPGKSVHCEAFEVAILEYRNTPRKDGLSPAERIFGRPMRTRVCAHPNLYQASNIQYAIEKADEKARIIRENVEQKYNKGTRKLKELKIGDMVRIQHHVTKKWDMIAKIKSVDQRKRSYLLETDSGRIYWRNRRFLRLYLPGGR